MFATLFRTAATATLATAATAVIIAFSAAPASASEAPRTARIATAGLDLTSPSGRAHVEARIARAARAVCGADDPQAWKQRPAIRACTDTAIANTRPQVAALAAAARDARTDLADVTSANARP